MGITLLASEPNTTMSAIYQNVAEKYYTSPKAVEEAIRTAIGVGLERAGEVNYHEYFGEILLNPTNFIAKIARKIEISDENFEYCAPAEATTPTVIGKMLNKLCISKKLNGYRFLCYAICLVAEDFTYIDHITSVLYPAVAQKLNTTPSRVERSMRTAVERCFSQCDSYVTAEIFGNAVNPKTGKVTNSEFIAGLAKYVVIGMDG